MQKLKRIAAMIGVIILVGMYVIPLILALTGSQGTQNLLMASIVCTIVVPVLIYAMMLVARVLNHTGVEDPSLEEHASDDSSIAPDQKSNIQETGSRPVTGKNTNSR
ncbi:MAG: hypothetical protein LUF30_05720 [Lachnospiraceae bacterium]|nr:hypothetical protein [Lachnospiraceae bacterium]